jgi:hypothetical protein
MAATARVLTVATTSLFHGRRETKQFELLLRNRAKEQMCCKMPNTYGRFINLYIF